MKKIILPTLLLMFLFLASCSSDNDSDLQKDELLSNTEWIYSDNKPIDSSTEEVIYDDESKVKQAFAYLSYSYPPIDLSNITIDNIEGAENKIDSVLIKQIIEYKINFTNDLCFYTNKDILYWKKQELKERYKRVKYPNQEGKNQNGIICKILPDGIYMINESLSLDNPGRNRLYLKLENYEYKWKIGNSVISENEYIKTKNEINYTLSFKRVENDILIENDSLEWKGLLNRNNNFITIEQTRPITKLIGEFKRQ